MLRAFNTSWEVVKNSDPRVGCVFLKTGQISKFFKVASYMKF